MVKRGFMKKGVRVVVHEYKDTVVGLPTSGVAKPPYELHFYPGLHKVLVVSVRK
jgi:hypothetical protein